MAAPEHPISRTIDARGSRCPVPLMALMRGLREAETGDLVAVLTSDKGSRPDIAKWVASAGHSMVGVVDRGGHDEIVVEKTR